VHNRLHNNKKENRIMSNERTNTEISKQITFFGSTTTTKERKKWDLSFIKDILRQEGRVRRKKIAGITQQKGEKDGE